MTIYKDWREELREEKVLYHEIKDRLGTPKEERLTKPDNMSTYEWMKELKEI